MAASKSTPRLNLFVASDAHKISGTGKIDTFGIFDTFVIWATPATRQFSLTAWLSDVPAGKTELTIYRRYAGKKPTALAHALMEADEPARSVISANRLRIKISNSKDFEIGVGFRNASLRAIKWLPFRVQVNPWVELPQGEQLKALLADPHAIKALRAELHCEKCGSRFVFEVSLNPDAKRERGVRPFPESGKFVCPKCKTVHYLKDAEGQLRSHIGKQLQGESK